MTRFVPREESAVWALLPLMLGPANQIGGLEVVIDRCLPTARDVAPVRRVRRPAL